MDCEMKNDNTVNISWVIKTLNLSEMPKAQALRILASYVCDGDLDMFVDENITGTDAVYEVEEYEEVDGNFAGGLIGNGFSYHHIGKKVVTGVDTYYANGIFGFIVNAYYFEEKRFYPTDVEGVWLRQKRIDEKLVYFDRAEVSLFASKLGVLPSSAPSKICATEPGVKKALALLAREKADLNPQSKFRKANSVNASGFRDHILTLAEKYLEGEEPSRRDHGLNSLDDKINEVLMKLDIKEIPK
jgi:hypothetical protein